MNALKTCPVCGKTMAKRKNESWPTYYAKTACSQSHAAQYIQQQKRRAQEIEANNNWLMKVTGEWVCA